MDYDLLKFTIRKKGISQDDLAARMGISRVSLCNKLSGKVSISVEEMNQIIKIAELSAEEANHIFLPVC